MFKCNDIAPSQIRIGDRTARMAIRNHLARCAPGVRLFWANTFGISAVDFDGNTTLTEINVDVNHLVSLDVSAQSELIHLWCTYNSITTLNITKNLRLELLNCGFNQLSELNLARNTGLKVLYCDHNPLHRIDVSNLPLLEDFWCYQCNLSWLDVSQNVALKRMFCRENNLTSLDLSANTALVDLDCSRNSFSIEAMTEILATLVQIGNINGRLVISGNKTLHGEGLDHARTLQQRGWSIDAEDMIPLEVARDEVSLGWHTASLRNLSATGFDRVWNGSITVLYAHSTAYLILDDNSTRSVSNLWLAIYPENNIDDLWNENRGCRVFAYNAHDNGTNPYDGTWRKFDDRLYQETMPHQVTYQ